MTASHYWLAMFCVAAGTLVFRLIFLRHTKTPALPPLLKRAMEFVPTAVLAALVIPQFITFPNFDIAVLGAGVAAGLSAWFLKLDFLPLVFGFVAYGLLRLIVG